MGQVWSDANKFAKWLEVELAATDALAEAGQVRRMPPPRFALAPKSMSPASTNSKPA